MGTQKTRFDGTTRLSGYLPLADGTRLAYYLILPTIEGLPSQRPLPTLLKYTPYLRRTRCGASSRRAASRTCTGCRLRSGQRCRI